MGRGIMETGSASGGSQESEKQVKGLLNAGASEQRARVLINPLLCWQPPLPAKNKGQPCEYREAALLLQLISVRVAVSFDPLLPVF